ncbi:hypothetical protein GUJ93_ZPchr0006g42605 [Zizania palustris]|uniref:Uncharacterized protein n=1 Tax=Zizania palustris TaxID=103762 RepID=A0A8J5VPX5_ZIZPA|nr:hypothetical protein GUJ93_ZPchr0006g42605 [Zizania palustris]
MARGGVLQAPPADCCHHKAAAVDDAESGGGGGAARLVWDSGSALYDSYELTSFRRQLDAALLSCGRSLSMPHMPPTAATQPPAGRRRRFRRLPALLRRLFGRVLLRLRFPASRPGFRADNYYGGHGDGGSGSPWSGALTSIPEESASPENSTSPLADGAGGPSALRKAQSERFVASKTASSMVQFEVVL